MFTFLTFAILLQVPAVQAESSERLYVAENVFAKNGLLETCLVRLSLDRDNKLVKETLLTTDQAFFGLFDGGHRIALGRFIVTKHGGVIDIQARRVIHDESDGDLLGVEDGKVIYLVNTANRPSFFFDRNARKLVNAPNRPSGLFCFDLNARKLAKLKSGTHWDFTGVKSPNRTMSVEHVLGKRLYRTADDGEVVGELLDNEHVKRDDCGIWLYQLGKPDKLLAKGFHFTYSLDASPTGNGVPCLWLDNKRILTVRTNNKLAILTTEGEVRDFAEIKDAPAEVRSPPRLWRDRGGQIIYSCARMEYLVDVQHRTASPLKNYSLAHGFEASVALNEQKLLPVYYDGKTIGQWLFDPQSQAATAPGRIAVFYLKVNTRLKADEPDYVVAIWDARVGDWRTIEMRVNSVIGWGR
jgi:hypothetical protein